MRHRSRSPRDSPIARRTSPSSLRQVPGQPRSPSSQNSSRSSSLGSPARSPIRTFDNKKSPNDDNTSVKSDSSDSSRKSKSSRESRKSAYSRGSRGIGRNRRKDDTSDSSDSSVDSSSRRNKNIAKTVDTQPEEISDGDMESEHEKEEPRAKEEPSVRHEINISHEDLSDVSDLEDSIGGQSDNENVPSPKPEEKVNGKEIRDRSPSPEQKKIPEKQSRPEEGEEQLDFEAEDGECEAEVTKENETDDPSKTEDFDKTEEKSRKEKEEKEKEELEEGEVTDEDDVRPEETEPRPVCRFFSRGQCTWGASCRFLHPGVTDKGNYTMFEMIRPVVPGEFRDERLYGKVDPPVVESAWERGLRTAKEMLRKSVKRKEQDIDFEEKKMNLSLAQEEFDKENGYYGRVTSPEPRYVRHVEYPVSRPPEEYYGRRQVVYEPEYVPPPPARERMRSYRELPAHRMPDFFNSKYEEEPPPQHSGSSKPRGNKPKREVIVQRVESERQAGRGDEWSDPWMRSKEAGRRKDGSGGGGTAAVVGGGGAGGVGRKRSYSSGSSYSSSSSSRSSSDSSRSSYRSRSRSLRRPRSRSHKGRPVSPSVIVSERKAANERAALMNPPAPKRRAPSPGMMRVSAAANPPAPPREDQFARSRKKLAVAAALSRIKRHQSSRSSSGSSGSSSSESDSSDSSSSTSRDNSPPVRSPAVELVKAMDALKGNALEKKQIKLNLKNPVGAKKPDSSEFRKGDSAQVKKRPANSPPAGDPKSKKATSRREELLKQLKAVEDAIAKKRSKVN